MSKEKEAKTEKKQPENAKDEAPEAKKEQKELTEKEYEEKVVELAKKGLTSEKIGEALRREGVHPQKHGKISRILKAKNIYQQADIENLRKKLEAITKHREKHIQDKKAMRERERIAALLKRERDYHKIA